MTERQPKLVCNRCGVQFTDIDAKIGHTFDDCEANFEERSAEINTGPESALCCFSGKCGKCPDCEHEATRQQSSLSSDDCDCDLLPYTCGHCIARAKDREQQFCAEKVADMHATIPASDREEALSPHDPKVCESLVWKMGVEIRELRQNVAAHQRAADARLGQLNEVENANRELKRVLGAKDARIAALMAELKEARNG